MSFSLRVLAVLALASSACTAPAPRRSAAALSGEPARVSLQDHRTGGVLTLVNDSHLAAERVAGGDPVQRRAAFYSRTRRDATTKVTTDEVMEALLDYFRAQGFDDIALPGPAPAGGSDVSQSLELLVDGRSRHALGRRGSTVAHARTFRECVQAFVALYNETYQLQSVETVPGAEVFQSPDAGERERGR